MRTIVSLVAASLSLAACGGGAPDSAGPVSEDEAQALNKAAEMLDDPRDDKRSEAPQTDTTKGDEREGL